MSTLWNRIRARTVRSVRALPFLAAETGASFVSAVWFFVLAIMVFSTVPGWLALPWGVGVMRMHADAARRRIGRYSGRPVDSAYAPLEGNWFDRAQAAFRDRATYRDLLWLAVHGVPGLVVGLIALAVPLNAVGAVTVPAYWWILPEDEPAAQIFQVTSWPLAFAAMGLGVVYLAVSILLLPAVARLRVWWASITLQPTQQTLLTRRVTELAESRASALEAHGYELRRIERDLHDGTQNKLVGVVMHLGIVERSLGRSPDQVRPVLAKAQEAAETALGELRDVVRNIYPPVLDERGLDGALGVVVARCPVDTTLQSDSLRRAPVAVESAAYFVVSEALTNIARHSQAEQASVRIATETDGTGDSVVIEVRDDGVGGAKDAGGSGLAGIRRRAAAFEGNVRLTSPRGGPTVLEVEIPCGS